MICNLDIFDTLCGGSIDRIYFLVTIMKSFENKINAGGLYSILVSCSCQKIFFITVNR